MNEDAAPQRALQIMDIARALGLDFPDIRFETVPWDVMDEIAAYGLPIRTHHWSYGRVFERQHIHGRMGLSKIYEIVINNDPVYAFLLDTNTPVENLLVTAHVAAHADFFWHNGTFLETNRNMVNEAAGHAARIDAYQHEHGPEAVENLMDVAIALERHIDPFKGLFRRDYPRRRVIETERAPDPFADLHDSEMQFSRVRRIIGEKIPPHPEKDILWFLARYAPLDEWKRDVLDMVREESYYFYPQFTTKILNEGWATYWHAEIIKEYEGMSPTEMLDFAALHGSVVQPGGGVHVNPYYLGYKMLVDVEQRWDRLYAEGQSPIDGRAKLFAIRDTEDDFSFVRNYLTQDLCNDLGLYTYGPACAQRGDHGRCPQCDDVVVASRSLDEVIEKLLGPRYHYGMPRIAVVDVTQGMLVLRHDVGDVRSLDREFAEKTLEYVHGLWQAPVSLLTRNERGVPIEMIVDDRGFRIKVLRKGR